MLERGSFSIFSRKKTFLLKFSFRLAQTSSNRFAIYTKVKIPDKL